MVTFFFEVLSLYAQESLSLTRCYELAVARSELIGIRAAQIDSAKANYDLAFASLFPELSLNLQHDLRDNPNFGRVSRGTSSFDDDSSGNQSGSLGRSQFVTSFKLTQPIFHGFREVLVAESLESSHQAAKLDQVRERDLLFLDVAELFYQALFFESDLKVFSQTEQVLLQRVKDLRDFVKLGKARESEVLAAESDLADLAATRERSQGALNSTRELLGSLVGVSAKDLVLHYEPWAGATFSLENGIEKAAERSDLLASKLRAESERLMLKSVERERWPALDFEGNGYAFDDPDRNRDWEIGLKLEMPIFDSGRIRAKVDEQRARLDLNELERTRLRRTIERDVRSAFAAVESSKAEIVALKKLTKSSQLNYESQRKDYELGVVTNLEVLQAIRQNQESARRLRLAELSLDLNQRRLEVAIGGVSS